MRTPWQAAPRGTPSTHAAGPPGTAAPPSPHAPPPVLLRAAGGEPVPEVLGADHLGVVHHFALVRRHLQGGQHVVHPRQVGGGARGHAVEPPLQDVEARPPGHVRALERVGWCRLRTPCRPQPQRIRPAALPEHEHAGRSRLAGPVAGESTTCSSAGSTWGPSALQPGPPQVPRGLGEGLSVGVCPPPGLAASGEGKPPQKQVAGGMDEEVWAGTPHPAFRGSKQII